MGDDTWKILFGAAVTGFSAMATALAWVVKAWRADVAELQKKLIDRTDAERERFESRDDQYRAALTKNADATHALADGLKDVVRTNGDIVDHTNTLTERIADWRDETRDRPRSGASDTAFKGIGRDPGRRR